MRVRNSLVALMLVLVALAAALAPSAGGSPSGATVVSGSATFTDPAGDAQGGPDVTRVALSGDPATGRLTVSVTAPGYPQTNPDALLRFVEIWIDADRNGATGDPVDGTEYELEAWTDPTGRYWDIARWDGAEWASIPESPTMSFIRLGDVLTWTVNVSDLGGARNFRFYVRAGTWNDAAARLDTLDEAPDVGLWSYDISTPSPQPTAEPKVGLLIRPPESTPRTPVAAKRFTVRYGVVFQRTETTLIIDLATGGTRTSLVTMWEPAKSGTMSCKATVASQSLARCGAFKGGEASVSFVVPKSAAGKTLRLEVKITATDAKSGKQLTAKRIVTYRVK